MTDPARANIARDLRCIHAVITRGLKVAKAHADSYIEQGYPGLQTKEGFVMYVRTLYFALHAHHLTEDEVGFPYFREKLPGAPWELLSQQHRQMEPLLAETQAAVDGVSVEVQPGDSLRRLKAALGGIIDLWHPHIGIEEEHIDLEKTGAMLPQEEHVRLNRLFVEHTQKHAAPDFLHVPFMLHNLTPEDRASLSALMPPILTQQLVPVVWKEKWAPMAPFLLE